MTTLPSHDRSSIRDVALAALIIHSAAWGSLALALVAEPASGAVSASERAFVPIASFGAYRVDGVRHGVHGGKPVRFVDMTLHNRSDETTHPETIQAVWWQGRNWGEQIHALRRDLSRFGMYDYVRPGQVIAVTYPMPVGPDIDGIRVNYMMAAKGEQERRWTWDELIAGKPGTLYHQDRPVGAAPAAPATPSASQTTAPEGAQPSAESQLLRATAPVLQGLLNRKSKKWPF